MTDRDRQRLVDEVVATAERLEDDVDDPTDLDVLEVKVEASLDGTPRTFTAVLTTGGPQIEVDVTNGVVRGFHGSDYHATHVDADDLLETLDFRYRNDWNANVNTDDRR